MKTQGELESELAAELASLLRDFSGRGPTTTHAHLVKDLAILHLRGTMTEAERQLFVAENGRYLCKQSRAALIDHFRPRLMAMVEQITGRRSVGLFHDLDPACEQEVMIVSLDGIPEFKKRA